VNAGNGCDDNIASSQPRMGRHHVARRVNAGNGGDDNIASAQPRMGRQHVARRVNAGNGEAVDIASAQPRMGRQGVARRVNAGNGEAVDIASAQPRMVRHHVARRVNAGNGCDDNIASSQPRMGRHHVARRVNAGNGEAVDIASAQPRTGRNHVARRVNAGNGGADNIASAQPRMVRQGVARRVNAGNTDQDRQTTIINADGDTTVNQYNSAGQVTETTDPNSMNITYSYDAMNRETGMTNAAGTGMAGLTTLVYDTGGNQTSDTNAADQTTTTTYDAMDRVSTVEDADDGTTTYAYTSSGQLYTLADPDNNTTTYGYNAIGEQTEVTSPSMNSGSGESSSTEYDAVHDQVGSVIAIGSTTAGAQDEITYDPFGNIVTQTDSSEADRFMFAGMEYDPTTGLYYDHARYYNPVIGRFISQDPKGFSAGDTNLYRYARNQPTSVTDPSGYGWGPFTTGNPFTVLWNWLTSPSPYYDEPPMNPLPPCYCNPHHPGSPYPPATTPPNPEPPTLPYNPDQFPAGPKPLTPYDVIEAGSLRSQ
jgi:RHS repeat-associated protein